MSLKLELNEDERRLMARLSTSIHDYKGKSGLLSHPLMQSLRSQSLTGDNLKKFCDIRYNAASEFIPLLERALKLAGEDASKADLAATLLRNWRDESGYDRDTGEKFSIPNAHSDWRKDFLDTLGVETTHSNHYPLYVFNEQDDLPTLVGMLLAAEMIIPRENERIRASVRRAFPGKFTAAESNHPNTPEQIKATLYLTDHIEHDHERHMPELLKAIIKNLSAEEQELVVKGAERFFEERKNLYDHMQRELGIETQARSPIQL